MTIAAELIKDAPAWAADYVSLHGEEGWFERHLERRPLVGVVEETHDPVTGTQVALTPIITHEKDGTVFVLVPELGLKFHDQFALRSLAFALNAAADEAEAILRGAK